MLQTPTIPCDDASSVEARILAFRPKVYRCCYRRLRHAADAEDATQEVFRKYLESFATVTGNPEAWLVRCARNTCVDHIRRNRRRRSREAKRGQSESRRDVAIGRLETQELVHHLLARLSVQERDLLQRHLVDRVPQVALAEQLGVSQQLISRRVQEAKGKMRGWLVEHLGTLGLGGALSMLGAGTARAGLTVAGWLHRLAAAPGLPLINTKLAPAAGAAALAIVLPSSETSTSLETSGTAPTRVLWHDDALALHDLSRSATTPARTTVHPAAAMESPRVGSPAMTSRATDPSRQAAAAPSNVWAPGVARPVPAVSSPRASVSQSLATRSASGVGHAARPTSPSTATASASVQHLPSDRGVQPDAPSPRLRLASYLFGRSALVRALGEAHPIGERRGMDHGLALFGFESQRFDPSFVIASPGLAPGSATLAIADLVLPTDGVHGIDSGYALPWAAASHRGGFASAPLALSVAGAASQAAVSTPTSILNLDRLELNGELVLDDLKSPRGSELVLAGVNHFAGDVSGAGHWRGDGTAVFAGTHSPGDSPAFVEVDGNLVYTPGSRLHLELAGLADGEYDRLTVAGDVALAADLTLSLIDGFRLAADQDFLVFDVAGTVDGRFANYGEGDQLAVWSDSPWLNPLDDVGLYITYGAGDGNDIALFTRLLGDAAPSGVATVPEPTTAIWLCLLLPWLLHRGQAKRRIPAFSAMIRRRHGA